MTSTIRRSIRAVAVGAPLALVLVACGSTSSPGQPVPAPATSAPTTITSSEPAESTATSLADINPCDLLTQEDLKALGAYGTDGEEQVGTARTCTWTTPAGATGPAIRTNVGLDGVRATNARSIKVGSHDAKISGDPDVSGACLVYLGVSDSSRVDVGASHRHGDPDKACDLAMRTAELVEKNLPEA